MRASRRLAPNAGWALTLAEATVAEEREVTVYRCPRDKAIVMLVTPTGIDPVPGSGYRIGDALGNPADIYLSVVGSANKVVFPASPHALDGWID
jgi:hypothetical protein